MSIQIRDRISPALARVARGIRDKRPVLEAMGLEMTSLTKRAFSDSALRAATWPPLSPATLRRKKGTPLRESGALWQSIRITEVTNTSVTVGSDRAYAAIHQLGGNAGRNGSVRIPARPFFPVLNGQLTPLAARKILAVAQAKIRSILGR